MRLVGFILGLSLVIGCTNQDNHYPIYGPNPDQLQAVTQDPNQVVVASIGQSNNCGIGALNPLPYSLPVDHAGVQFIRNGVDEPEYISFVTPDMFIIDELILQGIDPNNLVLVNRCQNGSSIKVMRDTLVPNLAQDLEDFSISMPDYIFYWQGEADARTEALAELYDIRLIGQDGGYSLKEAVETGWPGIKWMIVELRVRDDGYALPRHQQLVRSAQHLFGAYPDVCTIPSYDAELLPGNNQPHTSVVGTELVARRAIQSILNPVCL